MSLRYKGAVISATPPTLVAGAGASGAWTLQQQMQAIASGYWPVNGPFYIEEVFSTYLYTGNDSVQTITNGIDLAGKGGLIWLKKRNNTSIHGLWDTARGGGSRLDTSSTAAPGSVSPAVTFNSNGFTLPAGGSSYLNESSTNTYVSWTFRKQPKFFDVVTWTGDGNATKTISHNLGSAPGCIMVKLTSGVNGWDVYHRSLGTSAYVQLNTTAASTTISNVWGTITSTTFTATGTLGQNDPGATYVAYLFAHDAGGFGLSGSDNVISCGSYTGNGSATGPTVTLGYEPQLVMVKRSDAAANWVIFDNMRGMSETTANLLYPNLTDDEGIGTQGWVVPTATGFKLAITQSVVNANGGTYIYIAIRRGPMQTPTTGTSVFSPNAVTMTASGSATITTNFPVDLSLNRRRTSADGYVMDRLRGGSQTSYNFLVTQTTAAESSGSSVGVGFDNNTAVVDNNWLSGISANTIWWNFRRAPGFFDEVCYTGNGVDNRDITHNLGVAPELLIVKNRSAAGGTDWPVYAAPIGATQNLYLNDPGNSFTSNNYWRDSTPTATTFRVGTNSYVNANTNTYVAYLFATCPGVSKVGGYTGSGTTKQIDCGFTGGARFVMIKRTDSTGDWYVWDSARGIVAGNDPYLLLNSTAAEVTNTDYVDTYSAGFEISSTAPAAINANGGSFIFLAIA